MKKIKPPSNVEVSTGYGAERNYLAKIVASHHCARAMCLNIRNSK